VEIRELRRRSDKRRKEKAYPAAVVFPFAFLAIYLGLLACLDKKKDG